MTSSPWTQGARAGASFDGPLRPETLVDVCVVGAGIAGLSCAYQLTRAGLRVMVLDKGLVGSGETGRTSAHLASALDDGYAWLEQTHGEGGARLAAESHAAAIDCIELICDEEGIDCDFARVDGYLFATEDAPPSALDREHDAASRAGLWVERRAESCFPFFDAGPCLRFGNQAVFHPLRYLTGLAHAAVRLGAEIHTGVRVQRVTGGSPCVVTCRGGHRVLADHVVVATNAPIHSLLAVHTKQTAYRTYVIGAAIPTGSIEDALYWDTGEPYHYVRLARSEHDPRETYLLVGGEDHRTGEVPRSSVDPFARLEAWTRARFPMAERITHRWSGQILEPHDGLAYIGESPGLSHAGVYLATGDSGDGLTHGTIAGILLRDLILGCSNRWADLYAPARVSLRAVGEMAREGARVALHYTEWLRRPDVRSTLDIPRGEGAIVRHGAHLLAIYRDPHNALHVMSPVCRHLGCMVGWNPAEKTWDCPCHGSRYDCYGKLLSGPARSDLEILDDGDSDLPTEAEREPDREPETDRDAPLATPPSLP